MIICCQSYIIKFFNQRCFSVQKNQLSILLQQDHYHHRTRAYLASSLPAPYQVPKTVLYFGVCLLVPVLVPVLARILVDVTPPVHLVPRQLFFVQVTRIISIITKIAVTLAVHPLVSNIYRTYVTGWNRSW